VNGDEVRNIRFTRAGGYDPLEVNDLLDRIAAELDAGRPAGPLITHATFRIQFGRAYFTGQVDWFLEQLRRQEDPSAMARMNTDPWRDLVAECYCIRRKPGDLAVRIGGPSRQECADAWEDFGQQPGTRLSLVPTEARRHELRTAEQQTVATGCYLSVQPSAIWHPSAALSAGGRTFTLNKVTRSSWPGIAETISRDRPDQPAHSLKHQPNNKDPYLHQLLDETGTPVLYRAGEHTDRSDNAYIKFRGHRWLRFPVRGTSRADAIMTAVDQDGNKVARYRLARNETGPRKAVEITIHPDQQLTDELTLVIALSAPFLRGYFRSTG